MNDFIYITRVTKFCEDCHYGLDHKKVDDDIEIANKRMDTIVKAFDWCPYCSKMLVTQSYTFSAQAVPSLPKTVLEEIEHEGK